VAHLASELLIEHACGARLCLQPIALLAGDVVALADVWASAGSR
jgi:hypothetical protein